jgi:hypothetical protein
MALHDFWCQVCGQVLTDVNVPIDLGARAGAPEHCGQKTAWIPAVGRMDAYEPFQEFVARDGANREVVVDSLRTLRKVERESEQLARNGEGQPVAWRRYSQDKSNWDVHTLQPHFDYGEKPNPEAVKKFGLRRLGTVEPDHSYGPGVDDSNTSALDRVITQKSDT